MSTEETSSNESRRDLLRAGSTGGLALLLSACLPQDTTATRSTAGAAADETLTAESECASDTSKPGIEPTKEELDDAKKMLWLEFAKGTAVAHSTAMALETPATDHAVEEHGNILASKWHKFRKCERLTKKCAYMAGVAARGMADLEQTPKITLIQFKQAVAVVQGIQKYSVLDKVTDIGVIC